MKQVFVLLFGRLSSTKTTKFVKNLIVFFGYYIIRYGAENLITIIDEIQPQMFEKVIERVIITDMQKVSGEIERKVTAIGISTLLIDCPPMIQSSYNVFYVKILAALIEFFELPQDNSILLEDQMLPEVDDAPGYQAAYSQLMCARNPKKDPLEGKQTLFRLIPQVFH